MNYNNETRVKDLTVGELKELITNSSVKQTKESDIIFIEGVQQLTGYKKQTIYCKVTSFEIPVISRGRPLTFSRKKIIEWMNSGKPLCS